ncbi:hypothetical protein, partial [Butyricimonas virosa]|uniref:hypothetical protein n=2 Tax=Butyricimonas virosa TaxID=544645 RepID=UPI0026DD1A1A
YCKLFSGQYIMVALPFRYIMNIAWTWQLHNMNTDGCICSVCVVLEFRCCLREGIGKGLAEDRPSLV